MPVLEWDVLRGTSSVKEAGPSRHRSHDLARSLASADFKAVLTSAEVQEVLVRTPGLFDGLVRMSKSPNSSAAPTGLLNEEGQALRLIAAIALLHAFVQVNWTGPDLDFSLVNVLSDCYADVSLEELDAASLAYLTFHGEPAYHLCAHPSLFLIAIRLLGSLSHHPSRLRTLPWWQLRFHLVHQSLLDDHVDLPPETHEAIRALFSILPPDDQDLRASLHLETGLLHHSLGQDKMANHAFLAAAQASGLEFELSGALGKKTRFQVEEKTLLVLLAESRRRPDDAKDGEASVNGDSSEKGEGKSLPPSIALNDDTLLEETEFTRITPSSATATNPRLSHLEPSSQPPLHPLDQALLVSLCLSQHNNEPSSGLLASQMMPFLARVISHPRNWSIHTTALLLRSRLESNRSRTVERSALQLAALIEQMPTSDSAPQERLRFFHQLPLLSKWQMERELAKRYMTLGVVRSALDIFTRLEMWEDGVTCLQRMEKQDEAESIVRDLLEGKKIESDLVQVMGRASMSDTRRGKLTAGREAKLWCLLGDLALSSDASTRDPARAKQTATEHYEKAWEVSGKTSSRAMRSLGSLYVSRQEWQSAIDCFTSALEINPLYARAWFTLGVCYVRLEKWSEAKDAFRREVGVDEEDGEGWNNLAAVYLRLGEQRKADEDKSTSSFDNKLAFRALRQGLRFAHSNWRMWQNYMIVAVDVGELSEAARAMTRVIEETSSRDPAQALDSDVLDKLVDSVTRDDYRASTIEGHKVMPTTSNEGFGLLPIVERLFDKTILPRISDSPRVWRAHARLQRWKEDWSGAMDDYLRAYRCGAVQNQGVERDQLKFREAVEEVEELVDVLRALGPKVAAMREGSGEGKKGDWKFQARGIVRTFVGRTRESFMDEPEMGRLTELLEELKRAD